MAIRFLMSMFRTEWCCNRIFCSRYKLAYKRAGCIGPKHGLWQRPISVNFVGGMVAICDRCTLSNSYVIGNIKVSDLQFAFLTPSGLLGNVQGEGIVTNSYFLGTIDTNVNGGGLVGNNFQSAVVRIDNSRVIGSIASQRFDKRNRWI